ncbi:MAG TPA: peptidoglycan-associated lipoprotein Pal [Terriglobales bacterium]|nr:peptidoglycan-associated lipoprotein Pal [Terriglobales bacterium]
MSRGKFNLLQWFALLTVAFVFTGCSKKVAKVTPPSPPPAPPAPTAALAAAPDVVQQGQSTTLTWQTQNAADITITGIGTVPASGSRSITPGSSTTYTLTAKGPGGSQDASTRVTVNPVATAAKQPAESEEDLFGRNIKDIFFEFDKANIGGEERSMAQSDAQFLIQHPDVKVTIEGHCDERGSEEYNLALGASRANSLKELLAKNGIDAGRISTTSYGKEKPFCTGENEECWHQNRRDHLVYQR